jgi:hypothetical protein
MELETLSLGGKRYIVTFIDEYSRYAFIYLLHTKDEAEIKYMEYQQYVENYHGKRILELRTDNGGEYVNKRLQTHLKSTGTRFNPTQPFSPQQNGIAERYNRTITNQLRAIMHTSRIPKQLWGELALTVNYLRQRTPSSSINGKSPYELWHNSLPNIENLRIIWSDAYMHIPKQRRRGKLSPRAKILKLIGYNDSTTYRLYDVDTEKIYESRDVTFNEINHTSPVITDETEVEYEVERILLERVGDLGEKQYLVKYAGYDEPEWTDAANLEDCIALDDYEKDQQSTINLSPTALIASALTAPHITEPTTYDQAMKSPYAAEWKRAIDSEINSLNVNDTWKHIENLPINAHAIDSRWVFKTKYHADGSLNKFKARLVARGFTQRPGIDYDETYAPVVKFTTLRLILAIAAYQDMEIHQMDVKTAFLNGKIDTEIYMKLPPGVQGTYVKLKRSIYGLKQSPRLWNKVIDTYLKKQGFTASPYDSALYIRIYLDKIEIIALYVDDITICTANKERMKQIKDGLSKEFDMDDMGELHYILGIEVTRNREQRTIALGQPKYIDDIINRFDLNNAHTVNTPMDLNIRLFTDKNEKPVNQKEYQSIVGSLMYLMIGTRPDIAFAVSKLSQFLINPSTSHRTAAIRVLRYVKHTKQLKLTYGHAQQAHLHGYCDADYAMDVDTRRSTTGYVFKLNGGAISWQSKRQSSTALSTAEAEYMALAEATKEATWLRNILKSTLSPSSYLFETDKPTVIHEDNQSAIKLTYNPIDHKRTKHIDIRYHFTREAVENGHITLAYTPTALMTADILTKPLPYVKLIDLRTQTGLT